MLMPPPESTPREPRPTERTPDEFLALLKDARVLLQDGMARLGRNWDRLPQVKGRLWREGQDLQSILDRTDPRGVQDEDVLFGFVGRCGNWYMTVYLLRGARANGQDSTSSSLEAVVARVKEKLMPSPNGNPPNNRQIADAVNELADAVEAGFVRIDSRFDKLEAGQDELRGDVKMLKAGQDELQGDVKMLKAGQDELQGDVKMLKAGQDELQGDVKMLKAGQDELQGDVKILKAGQAKLETRMGSLEASVDRLGVSVGSLEGRVGNIAGEAYEKRFRETLPGRINKACSELGIPYPTVDRLWDDRESVAKWPAVCAVLNLNDSTTRLDLCDFLFRLEWDTLGVPPLLLVGEIALTADERRLAKAAGHRRDLEAAGHQVQSWLIGSAIAPPLAEKGGEAVVEDSGVEWFRRPREFADDAWYGVADIKAVLANWLSRQGVEL